MMMMMIGFYNKLTKDQSIQLTVICSKLMMMMMMNDFIINNNNKANININTNTSTISLINDNDDNKFFMFNSLIEVFNRLLLINTNTNTNSEGIDIIISVSDIITAFIIREGMLLSL